MYIDPQQYQRWLRMSRYDALPPYKRSILQRHNDLYTLEEVKKHNVKTLLANRARRIAYIARLSYGEDHPQAGEK